MAIGTSDEDSLVTSSEGIPPVRIARKPLPGHDESSTHTPLLTSAQQEALLDDTSSQRRSAAIHESREGTEPSRSRLNYEQLSQDQHGHESSSHHDSEPDEHPAVDSVKAPATAVEKVQKAPNKQSKRQRSSLATIDDWWIWEPLGLLFSALGLAGIIGLLAYYDGKEQPQWTHVSINTVVSWLSTVAKAGAVVPLATSIGQLKWIRQAERNRPLTDLALFDSASRGEIGALRLLFSAPLLHLANIAAVATVLALAFDPFNQNLAHIVPGMAEDATQKSTVSNGSVYLATGPFSGGDEYLMDPVMKANLYNSLLNPNQPETWTTPLYQCPSGNCTWNPIAVLGARALCTNITDRLVRTCGAKDYYYSELTQPCNITLPNGVAATYNFGGHAMPLVINVNGLGNQLPGGIGIGWSNPGVVYSNKSLLIAQSILAEGSDKLQSGEALTSINNDTRWTSSECSIEPVIRSVQPSVQFSKYSEEIIDTWTRTSWFGEAPQAIDSQPTPDSLYWGFQPPWNTSKGMHSGKYFGLGYDAYNSMTWTLEQFFIGNVTEESDSFQLNGNYSDIIESIFYGSFTHCATPNDKLRCAFDNVAKAISKTWRDSVFVPGMGLGRNVAGQYGSGSPNASQLDTTMAQGTTLAPTTFVRVHWYWLCLPVLVWVLALITWLATVWMTRRSKVPRWRNGLLPLLFLYREVDHNKIDYVSGEGDGLSDHDEKRAEEHVHGVSNESYLRRAERIKVRLIVGDNKARLES